MQNADGAAASDSYNVVGAVNVGAKLVQLEARPAVVIEVGLELFDLVP